MSTAMCDAINAHYPSDKSAGTTPTRFVPHPNLVNKTTVRTHGNEQFEIQTDKQALTLIYLG